MRRRRLMREKRRTKGQASLLAARCKGEGLEHWPVAALTWRVRDVAGARRVRGAHASALARKAP